MEKFHSTKNILDGTLDKRVMKKNHIIYDIESLLVPKEQVVGKQKSLNTHILLSIGAVAFIDGEYFEYFGTIQNMTENARLDLIRNFLEFCNYQIEKVEVPEEVENLIEHLQETSENVNQVEKSIIAQNINKLKKLKTTPIFGFNSQRYDLKILIENLLIVLSEKFALKDIGILKRGTSYFSITAPGLQFRDVLNFHSPINLDGYLKSWTNGEEKWPYPFLLFKNIEEIKNQIEFPAFEKFEKITLGIEWKSFIQNI